MNKRLVHKWLMDCIAIHQGRFGYAAHGLAEKIGGCSDGSDPFSQYFSIYFISRVGIIGKRIRRFRNGTPKQSKAMQRKADIRLMDCIAIHQEGRQ